MGRPLASGPGSCEGKGQRVDDGIHKSANPRTDVVRRNAEIRNLASGGAHIMSDNPKHKLAEILEKADLYWWLLFY
jgi:hypothetical protein